MSDADTPAALVSKLLHHRKLRHLPCTVATATQPAEPISVWGLCTAYDETHFDAMDEDFNRNAAYARAFAAVPGGLLRWLEIGCGASATLTKLALKHGPHGLHITAFEANEPSAAAARQSLQRLHSVCRRRRPRIRPHVHVISWRPRRNHARCGRGTCRSLVDAGGVFFLRLH